MTRVRWQVRILNGADDIDVTSAPVMFGGSEVTVFADGSLSPVREPLAYGPVSVFTIDDSVVIRTYDEWQPDPQGGHRARPTDHRTIFQVNRIEFDHWGTVRISGLEERKDGSLTLACWLVEPYDATMEG